MAKDLLDLIDPDPEPPDAAPVVRPRGRGTGLNPQNRFEALRVLAEEPGPEKVVTQLLADTSRSVIARNDSPDVGFETSVNPYRGCEHGCAYCLAPDTPVLMADGSTRKIGDLEVGDEIYGTVREGWYRRYVRTRVHAQWRTRKEAHAIVLADGTRLVASGDHRFLTDRGWKHVAAESASLRQRPRLTARNSLMGTGAFQRPETDDDDYRRGYLTGIIRGDALIGDYEHQRAGRRHGNQHQFRLALADGEALDRSRDLLAHFGVLTHDLVFAEAVGERRRIEAIRTHSRPQVERIRALVAWPTNPTRAWRRGFLAGIFDAEGSYGSGVLRISDNDAEIIDQVTSSLRHLGFGHAIEVPDRRSGKPIQVVRLTGGLQAHLRFFHTVGTAISRKRSIAGHAVKSAADLRIVSIEPIGVMDLVDITTGTGDFIADGVVSHNCYARPYHEYLGFSAGLDFESKILVKEQAPELLRRELMSPKWEPQLLVLSGVTDCYQPAERRLEITRRCLAVLAELRNPAAVITKNHLVTRDIDLLGELARHQAGAVTLSITTLDPEVARKMEPRASSPRDRLDAVAKLAAAGIPVGVNAAPIIPGLTDHELPAILTAAKEAGASWARYLVVRLPFAVKEVFVQWLAEQFPERKEKVLSRIRELRGGKLNDPRFGVRHRGEGIFADQLEQMYRATCRRIGLPGKGPELTTEHFRRPGQQLGLF